DIGPHNHTGTTAERGVVHGGVFIARESADVHRFERPDAPLQAPPGERMGERPREHLGEKGQGDDAPAGRIGRGVHVTRSPFRACAGNRPSGGTTTMRPACKSTTGTDSRVKGSTTG